MIDPISRPPTSRLEVEERQAELFAADAVTASQMMLGWTLTWNGVGGRIVETEAYDREDPASHSFNGPKTYNAVLFGPPGRAYVYRSYGIHWCLNLVVSGSPPGAILIRALEPTLGLDVMSGRRGMDDPRLLCSGPGRLCQALAVSRDQDGLPMGQAPFDLVPGPPVTEIAVGPRIGITRAAERPWRFGEKGSRYLSRPFPKG
jgi:DNA-3-methyladenine glycosylase